MCDLWRANDSQACRESARQVLGHSKMPSPFPGLHAHGPCVCMLPAQSGPKPSDNLGSDLTLANDSQACRECVRQLLGHSKMPSFSPVWVRMRPAQSVPKHSDTLSLQSKA